MGDTEQSRLEKATRDSCKRVLLRYTLFQIPGLAGLALLLVLAVRWLGLSETLAYLVFALWVIKDVALYPFVRVAYGSGGSGGAAELIGAVGVAKSDLHPHGYVQIGAESWRAETSAEQPVDKGSSVRVRAVRGLTLLVEP